MSYSTYRRNRIQKTEFDENIHWSIYLLISTASAIIAYLILKYFEDANIENVGIFILVSITNFIFFLQSLNQVEYFSDPQEYSDPLEYCDPHEQRTKLAYYLDFKNHKYLIKSFLEPETYHIVDDLAVSGKIDKHIINFVNQFSMGGPLNIYSFRLLDILTLLMIALVCYFIMFFISVNELGLGYSVVNLFLIGLVTMFAIFSIIIYKV